MRKKKRIVQLKQCYTVTVNFNDMAGHTHINAVQIQGLTKVHN